MKQEFLSSWPFDRGMHLDSGQYNAAEWCMLPPDLGHKKKKNKQSKNTHTDHFTVYTNTEYVIYLKLIWCSISVISPKTKHPTIWVFSWLLAGFRQWSAGLCCTIAEAEKDRSWILVKLHWKSLSVLIGYEWSDFFMLNHENVGIVWILGFL